MKAKKRAYVRNVPPAFAHVADLVEQAIGTINVALDQALASPSEAWLEGSDYLQRARASLVRALVGEPARTAEVVSAFGTMLASKGIGASLSEVILELAWVDDNYYHVPAGFHATTGRTLDDIGRPPPVSARSRAPRRRKASS